MVFRAHICHSGRENDINLGLFILPPTYKPNLSRWACFTRYHFCTTVLDKWLLEKERVQLFSLITLSSPIIFPKHFVLSQNHLTTSHLSSSVMSLFFGWGIFLHIRGKKACRFCLSFTLNNQMGWIFSPMISVFVLFLPFKKTKRPIGTVLFGSLLV